MSDKNSFIMYADTLEYTMDMTDEQMGQLYRAQLLYANGQEPVITDPEVRGVWRVVKHRMDLDSKKYQDKCKQMRANASKSKQTQANATKSKQIESDNDNDTDTDIKERVSKDTPKKRFTPPSVDEVRAYCRERRNNVDPDRFVDFYASKGWKVGKETMKDWKAAVRNWERDRQVPVKPPNDQHGISRDDDLDAILMSSIRRRNDNYARAGI